MTVLMQQGRTTLTVTEHFHGAAGVSLAVKKGPAGFSKELTKLSASFAAYGVRRSSEKGSWDIKPTFPHAES